MQQQNNLWSQHCVHTMVGSSSEAASQGSLSTHETKRLGETQWSLSKGERSQTVAAQFFVLPDDFRHLNVTPLGSTSCEGPFLDPSHAMCESSTAETGLIISSLPRKAALHQHSPLFSNCKQVGTSGKLG